MVNSSFILSCFVSPCTYCMLFWPMFSFCFSGLSHVRWLWSSHSWQWAQLTVAHELFCVWQLLSAEKQRHCMSTLRKSLPTVQSEERDEALHPLPEVKDISIPSSLLCKMWNTDLKFWINCCSILSHAKYSIFPCISPFFFWTTKAQRKFRDPLIYTEYKIRHPMIMICCCSSSYEINTHLSPWHTKWINFCYKKIHSLITILY